MSLQNILNAIQNIQVEITNKSSYAKHLNSLIEHQKCQDSSSDSIQSLLKEAKSFIDNNSEDLLQEAEELLLSVQGLRTDLSELQDNIEEVESTLLEDNDQIKIKFSTFKKLLALGTVTELEGQVVYSDRTGEREDYKSGKVFDLALNRESKIRPPINCLREEDDVSIKFIEIVSDEGVVFEYHGVKALLKVLVGS